MLGCWAPDARARPEISPADAAVNCAALTNLTVRIRGGCLLREKGARVGDLLRYGCCYAARDVVLFVSRDCVPFMPLSISSVILAVIAAAAV